MAYRKEEGCAPVGRARRARRSGEADSSPPVGRARRARRRGEADSHPPVGRARRARRREGRRTPVRRRRKRRSGDRLPPAAPPRIPRENRVRGCAKTTRRQADGTTRNRPPRSEGGRGRSRRLVVSSSCRPWPFAGGGLPPYAAFRPEKNGRIEESDALASLAIWRTLGQDEQTARSRGSSSSCCGYRNRNRGSRRCWNCSRPGRTTSSCRPNRHR